MNKINEINEIYKSIEITSNSSWAKKSSTPESMMQTKVDDLIFMFDPKWKRVGVNLSGGPDSALCTYFICKFIKEMKSETKVYAITFVRNWENRPWAGPISEDVFNILKEMFPDIIQEQIFGFIPPELEEAVSGKDLHNGKSGDRIFGATFNNYISFKYKLDAMYNATTQNPEVRLTDHDPYDRNNSDLKIYKNKQTELTKWCYFSFGSFKIKPWYFVTKDWLVKQYIKNDLLELFDKTRSCEGDSNYPGIHSSETYQKYISYKHGESAIPPECGTCFWCKERNWAIKKIKNV